MARDVDEEYERLLGRGYGVTEKYKRLAVKARVFPLLEIEDGERYTLNVNPDAIPVGEYLKAQGRFSHLTDQEIEKIQSDVNREWRRLLKRTEFSSALFHANQR